MSIACTTGQLYTTAASKAPDTSDLALIQSIAASDKHAMQILYARHNVRVFRFLLRFVADKSAAEDLVSEVFLDVWRQAGNFRAQSQVSTWLLAIARNKAISALRRRSTEELDDASGSSHRGPAGRPGGDDAESAKDRDPARLPDPIVPRPS